MGAPARKLRIAHMAQLDVKTKRCLIEAYQDGLSLSEVARRFNVRQELAGTIVDAAGVRRANGVARAQTAEEKASIFDAHARGIDSKTLAAKYGRSQDCIRAALREERQRRGIAPPKPGPGHKTHDWNWIGVVGTSRTDVPRGKR